MDKLADDLRQDARMIRGFAPNADATTRVLVGAEHADKLDEAADEITRLKGEVEQLTGLVREAYIEGFLAGAQERGDPSGKAEPFAREMWKHSAARSSGKAGSDA